MIPKNCRRLFTETAQVLDSIERAPALPNATPHTTSAAVTLISQHIEVIRSAMASLEEIHESKKHALIHGELTANNILVTDADSSAEAYTSALKVLNHH